jgi:hypothetical protein
MSSSIHPFLHLSREKQGSLFKELGEGQPKSYAQLLASAVKSMKQGEENNPVSREVLQARDLLNSKSQQILEKPFVTPWKQTDVTFTAGMFGLSWAATALSASVGVAAGLSVYYIRSHRVIALVTGCAAYSLWYFRGMCLSLHGALEGHIKVLNDLSWQNQDQFSTSINGVYEGFKKTSYLMKCYINAHRKRDGSENYGVILLTELRDAINVMIEKPDRKSTAEDIQNVDLTKIRSFFVRFEKVCRKGLYGTVTLGVIAVAWTYYAYVQKAYLMTIAGIVQFVAASTICRELYVFQRGSKNIFSVQENKVADAFQEMAARSMLFWAMDLEKADRYQIQNTVVIPFDAILKLIPSWKDPVQVK